MSPSRSISSIRSISNTSSTNSTSSIRSTRRSTNRSTRRDIRRRDIGWKSRWNYLVGPPGWSHDGSKETSRQLLKREEGAEAENGLVQGL